MNLVIIFFVIVLGLSLVALVIILLIYRFKSATTNAEIHYDEEKDRFEYTKEKLMKISDGTEALLKDISAMKGRMAIIPSNTIGGGELIDFERFLDESDIKKRLVNEKDGKKLLQFNLLIGDKLSIGYGVILDSVLNQILITSTAFKLKKEYDVNSLLYLLRANGNMISRIVLRDNIDGSIQISIEMRIFSLLNEKNTLVQLFNDIVGQNLLIGAMIDSGTIKAEKIYILETLGSRSKCNEGSLP